MDEDVEAAWTQVVEKYFVEERTLARETLPIYEQLLKGSVTYEPGNAQHELLRWSGLAKLSARGDRLDLRCPLYREAFGPSWVERTGSGLATITRRAVARREKRLMVIGTGGTIGMVEQAGGEVGPTPGKLDWLSAVGELAETVDFEPLMDYDSANVGPAHWSQIVSTIVRHQADYDGFIVAHGTDTMAYSASAVAFALGADLSFPVVFTGSQTTVDVPHGDAVGNVLRAALVAMEDIPEVVICFGDKVFRAVRTQKKDDQRFDAFESPGYPELGFVAERVEVLGQNLLHGGTRDTQTALTGVRNGFATGILYVAQTPGSEARFYEHALEARDADGEPLCRAVVIQSLGAGNVPTEPVAFDLTSVIRRARELEVPVILTSQYPVLPANFQRYSPSLAAIKAGAVPTGNMTTSAVVAKLSWVLHQADQELREGLLSPARRTERVEAMMRREYVGEGGRTIEERSAAARRDGHGAESFA